MKELTKREVSEFRKKIENAECGTDFMVEYLRWVIVHYLKHLEEKLAEKEVKDAKI